MPNLNATTNDYSNALTLRTYDMIPKAVLAAVAVSALTSGGDCLDEAQQAIVTEWNTLHQNGIVPQAVPAKLRQYIRESVL